MVPNKSLSSEENQWIVRIGLAQAEQTDILHTYRDSMFEGHSLWRFPLELFLIDPYRLFCDKCVRWSRTIRREGYGIILLTQIQNPQVRHEAKFSWQWSVKFIFGCGDESKRDLNVRQLCLAKERMHDRTLIVPMFRCVSAVNKAISVGIRPFTLLLSKKEPRHWFRFADIRYDSLDVAHDLLSSNCTISSLMLHKTPVQVQAESLGSSQSSNWFHSQPRVFSHMANIV